MLMHFPTLENIYAACQKRVGTDTCLGLRADFEDCMRGEECELSYDNRGECLGGATCYEINLSGSRDNILKSIENVLKNVVSAMNGEKIDALVLIEGTRSRPLEGTNSVVIFDAVMLEVWKDIVHVKHKIKHWNCFMWVWTMKCVGCLKTRKASITKPWESWHPLKAFLK